MGCLGDEVTETYETIVYDPEEENTEADGKMHESRAGYRT